MTAHLDPFETLVAGARCWGIELEPRFRVLAVTVEPDPLRVAGTPGEHQLLCFPVSVLLASLTRGASAPDSPPTLLTFDLEQLTAVSERFAGVAIDAPVFGSPEPRPGSWGPRYSLEGRSSAPDGTGRTLTLDLVDGDARLRVFVRCDDLEVRDRGGAVLHSTLPAPRSGALFETSQGDARGDRAAGTARDEREGPDSDRLTFG